MSCGIRRRSTAPAICAICCEIMVPLSSAPIMTVVLFGFIGSWNALAWPILVTTTPDWRPISYGLLTFLDEAGSQFHLQMAGAVITMAPVDSALLLYAEDLYRGHCHVWAKGVDLQQTRRTHGRERRLVQQQAVHRRCRAALSQFQPAVQTVCRLFTLHEGESHMLRKQCGWPLLLLGVLVLSACTAPAAPGSPRRARPAAEAARRRSPRR